MKIGFIDGANLFIKCLSISRINDQGNFVGCIEKFLDSVKNIVFYNNIDLVVVFWEGRQSTLRKRRIQSSYKSGKKEVGVVPDEDAQKCHIRIREYLDLLSIPQLEVSGTEADEVIAYLARRTSKEHDVVIISEDKDFYQLINDNTSIFSIQKRLMLTKEKFIETYKIQPENWIIIKCLMGDSSDNIKPLTYVPIERLRDVYFPILKEQRIISIDDISTYSAEILKTASKQNMRVYKKIIDSPDVLAENFKLMNLRDIMLPNNMYSKIKYALNTFCFKQIDPAMLRYEMFSDSIFFMGFNRMFQVFVSMSNKMFNEKLDKILFQTSI